jgi:hypothetical protein
MSRPQPSLVYSTNKEKASKIKVEKRKIRKIRRRRFKRDGESYEIGT